MRRKSALIAVAGCLSAVFLRPCPADDSPQKGAKDNLHLTSQILVPSVAMTGKSGTRSITSFEIRGTLPDKGDGTATVRLDQSTYSFNDFGDARMTLARPGKAQEAVLRFTPFKSKIRGRGLSKHYRIYEIAFKDKSYPDQLSLVIADKYSGPHRLIVRNGQGVVRIIALQGKPEIPAVLKDRPVGETVVLRGFAPRDASGPHRISIWGEIGDKGHLLIDRNYLSFDNAGNVTMSTLIGYFPQPVRLQKLEVPDPAKTGRKLIELIPAEKQELQYFVVQPSTESGEHRLVVRSGKTCEQILRLQDPARESFRRMISRLDDVPKAERDAIDQIQKAMGYDLQFLIQEGHITHLGLSGRVKRRDLHAINQALKELGHLRELNFSGVRLSEAGLANLATLKRLTSLHFTSCEIDDRGLKGIQGLTNLESLHCYCCTGFSDRTLSYLSRLKKLKWIRIYRARRQASKDVGITGSGLKHLGALDQLESLDLMGQDLSDDGLKHLAGLKHLKSLIISGEDVTDDGLTHLATLRKLSALTLYETSASNKGATALKAKLPKLNVSLSPNASSRKR